MAGAFDKLEELLNSSVHQHLTNRVITMNGNSVAAIFDNEFGVGFNNSGAEVATTEPQIQVLTSDVPNTPIGKQVLIDGKSFKIKSNQPDGTGWSLLKLELV